MFVEQLNEKVLNRFGEKPVWKIRQLPEDKLWRAELTLKEKTWVNFQDDPSIAMEKIAVEAILYLNDLDRPYDYFEESVWGD